MQVYPASSLSNTHTSPQCARDPGAAGGGRCLAHNIPGLRTGGGVVSVHDHEADHELPSWVTNFSERWMPSTSGSSASDTEATESQEPRDSSGRSRTRQMAP